MIFLELTFSNRTMTILGMLTGIAFMLIIIFIARFLLNKQIKKNNKLNT